MTYIIFKVPRFFFEKENVCSHIHLPFSYLVYCQEKEILKFQVMNFKCEIV